LAAGEKRIVRQQPALISMTLSKKRKTPEQAGILIGGDWSKGRGHVKTADLCVEGVPEKTAGVKPPKAGRGR